MTKRVIVGMSGGVDSAVAAYLLKKQGYDVIGVFMKNWGDEKYGSCSAREDYDDVRSVCETLDIPYYQVNFEKEYWDRVFKYFLNEYEAGRTPNPDVMCNSEIKFESFLKMALNAGSDLIATGHYARVEKHGNKTILKKGVDENKDQSYFLCMLTQRQLKNVIFPVGSMLKTQIRKIADNLDLCVANKKDSTGICFIGERKFKQFLKNYIPAKPGKVCTRDGACIGTHEGLMYYTLGQRRGLSIGGVRGFAGGRWFVIEKDMANNVLYVQQGTDCSELYSTSLEMQEVNFIVDKPIERRFTCKAKVRYRQPDQFVEVEYLKGNGYRVNFEQKQRAITPGQYCVLYDGDVCLGGGIIDKTMR